MEKNYVKVVKKEEDMNRIMKVDEMHFEILDTAEEFEFDRLTYPPGQKFKHAYSHKGEEASYLLKGTIDYELGDETIRMSAGDWLWHPSSILHNSGNPDNKVPAMPLYGVGPSTFLHPEVDDDLVKPQPHPKIAGMEKPYLYVPANHILDKKEIDSIILKTRIMAPRIMGYEIVFSEPSLRFSIKQRLFEGNSLLYVLEGDITIEIGETKDMLSPAQAVSFSSALGCLCTSKNKARLLMYNIGGRYYVPNNPKIVKEP